MFAMVNKAHLQLLAEERKIVPSKFGRGERAGRTGPLLEYLTARLGHLRQVCSLPCEIRMRLLGTMSDMAPS